MSLVMAEPGVFVLEGSKPEAPVKVQRGEGKSMRELRSILDAVKAENARLQASLDRAEKRVDMLLER